jgi:MoaA/NifB/PqqE/SkfB family radical SAM enzyme
LGDPAAAKDTLEIFKYFRTVNPNITLGMNTNGGLKSPKWWGELAKVMNKPNDYVVFSIDGLKDTNHIYRRNVIWERVIENAKSFIDNNGSAHWDMLVFKHNEHQVNIAENVAKDLGFTWFRAKVSKRHTSVPAEGIDPPLYWQDPVVESKEIDCYALKENSIYVDAQGKFNPCCWQVIDSNQSVVEVFRNLEANWDKNPDLVCEKICGTDEKGTSFSNQWQRSSQLR